MQLERPMQEAILLIIRRSRFDNAAGDDTPASAFLR
jgi:hypothetical protein